MRQYVSRLIKAGMPRIVAVSVCRQFLRLKGEDALAEYVAAVEEENGEMAAV
jgi:hypothetical protein